MQHDSRSRHPLRPLLWLPAVMWAATIFWLSSQPKLPSLPYSFSWADKVVHAGVFAVLAFLCLLPERRRTLKRVAVWTLAVVLYGLSDEYHQSFVPGRTPDLLDAAADALGAFIVASGALLWESVRLKRGKGHANDNESRVA